MHELAAMLGLSRGTVKKGVRTLVDEGLLVQQPGRGTFVTKPVMARSASGHLLSFAEAMGEQGHTRNPVPFVAVGPKEEEMRSRVKSLVDVTPAILRFI